MLKISFLTYSSCSYNTETICWKTVPSLVEFINNLDISLKCLNPCFDMSVIRGMCGVMSELFNAVSSVTMLYLTVTKGGRGEKIFWDTLKYIMKLKLGNLFGNLNWILTKFLAGLLNANNLYTNGDLKLATTIYAQLGILPQCNTIGFLEGLIYLLSPYVILSPYVY